MQTGDGWHEQSEQSAGELRLRIMWLLYAWCGKDVQKIVTFFVMLFIYPFAKPARRALRDYYRVLEEYRSHECDRTPASENNAHNAPCDRTPASENNAHNAPCDRTPASENNARNVPCDRTPVRMTGHPRLRGCFFHLLGFAWSLADKTDACTLKKNLPEMSVRDDEGWRAFRELLTARKGAFLMSAHVGTIEVLPALAQNNLTSVPHVHAFQQMGHDAVFTKMFMRRFDARSLTLHAVESVGVETAVEMQQAVGRGELVLMAGDRLSAGSSKTLAHDFLGRPCRWPKGVFVFARLMEAPVFFVTCVRTGWNAYECHFRQCVPDARNSLSGMLDGYVSFLQDETLLHPDQWFQFYDFFGTCKNDGLRGSNRSVTGG